MRRLIASVLVLLFSFIGIGAAQAADGPVKVVYHMVEGVDQASRGLANIRNHLAADPTAKIVVVAHGRGIDFLLNDAKDSAGQSFEARIAALANQGVDFRVCRNTLEVRKIDESKVVQEAKIVPSGVAEVAKLQFKDGYAYLRP